MALRPLRDFSLASRFSALLGLSIGFVIVVTTGVFVWYELLQGRQQQESEGIVLAEVAAWNSSAALAFGDARAAQPVLASLAAQAGVVAAYIQYPDGRIFARFEQDSGVLSSSEFPVADVESAAHVISLQEFQQVLSQRECITKTIGSYLHTLAPIMVNDDMRGVVHVVNDQRILRARQRDLLRIAGLILGIALGVSWLLVVWARRSFLVPVQRLAGAIREVTEGHDYSARVVKLGNDELGALTDSFNALLMQLQNRERRLAQYQAELENAVGQRTAELSRSNQALSVANEELVLSNQSLEDARDAAESADRAKMAFLANMSHEIRTPMNAVYGLADLLAMTALDETQQSYLRDLKLAASTLLELIDDVLDIAKIEANSMRLSRMPFQVTQLLDRVRTVVGNQASLKQLDFTLECDPHIAPFLSGDLVRLTQVLVNLCGNAVKFTTHGHVRLQLTRMQTRGPAQTAVETIRFSVSDTGIGIDTSDLNHLFDAFNQADGSITRRFGGTGLGLTISRHLVEKMGGQITVESTLGEGSCFSFELEFPVANVQPQDMQQQDREKQDRAPLATPDGLRGFHLLLVEDVVLNQQVMRALLESKGARVSVAADGEQALECLQAFADIDLVFMDLRMPVLDGFSTTKRIRRNEKTKNIPIVALTADATSHEKARCFEVGMNAYLSKPVEMNNLCVVVRDVLTQSRRDVPMLELPQKVDVQIASRFAKETGKAVGKAAGTMAGQPEWVEDGSRCFPELPWADRVAALQTVGGDFQLYAVALQSARELMPQMLEDFVRVAREVDHPDSASLAQIGELAHGFIGPLGSLGAMELVDRARQLEQRCLRPELAGRPLQWPADFEMLSLPVQDLVDALLELGDEEVHDDPAEVMTTQGSVDVREQLCLLHEFMESHRFESLEMIQQLLAHSELENYRVLADGVYLALKRFRFSDGIATLDRLIEALEKDREGESDGDSGSLG